MPSWKGKSRGGAVGYRFFIFLITKLGIKFAYTFLVFVIIHFVPFAPAATKAAYLFYRKGFRYSLFKTIGMIFVNYYRFGQILIDRIAVKSKLADKYRYEFDNYEHFLSVLNGGTGVIMIGAHVGNWEVGGSFFGEYSNKINIVMYDAEYQKIKDVLEKNTDKIPYKVIPVSEQDFEHIYRIKDALDAKEYVCFQGDRFISDKKSYTFDFFGKNAKFPAGPFYLADKYNVPIVFYFSMREKGMKYRFIFRVAEPASEGEKSSDAAYRLAQQYVNVLEDIVKKYPEQWFNYYKFWDV